MRSIATLLRSGLLMALLGLVLTAAAPAIAGDAADRLAIKGYDPVAYFTEGRPVQGSPEYEVVWDNARWRFASAANRDRFMADPDRYAPQYGGFCAMGVALGQKFEVDPTAWAIVDGKLYLNYDKNILAQWRQDPGTYIRKADAAWPGLRQ